MESRQPDRTERLLRVGRTVVAEHDTAALLDRILAEARAITGARYAALGVLDETRTELERFITSGIAQPGRDAIGDLPRGRGVLGVLIRDPRPLRLDDVSHHPESYGFPSGHPEMRSFLGVPILIRGRAWGNLYLTEKDGGGPFSDEDEEAVVVLAQWAGTAIDNARLFEASERRRVALEQAVRSLEAARDIADAVGGAGDLGRTLELIAKRGRALVEARTVLIMLRDDDELVVAAAAGYATGAVGARLPVIGSSSGTVLERGTPERVDDVTSDLRVAPADFGVPDARRGLIVPMRHGADRLGVLAAFDRGPAREPFTSEDEQLLRTFAGSAASAVALNRSVEAERLRSAVRAADAERARWARDLHDQTLQSLAAIRVGLAAALARADGAAKDAGIRQAIEDVEYEIGNLRAIISDLRPAILDDLGLVAALEALADRRRETGLEVICEVALPDRRHGEAGLEPDLETTIYRLVQEALTNVVKHAGATRVRVGARIDDGAVRLEVADDGRGFATEAPAEGFGLAGMRERAFLAGGRLEVISVASGTIVRAALPVRLTELAAG